MLQYLVPPIKILPHIYRFSCSCDIIFKMAASHWQTKMRRLPKLMSEEDLNFGRTRCIIFSLKNEIGGLAKALKLFQVTSKA